MLIGIDGNEANVKQRLGSNVYASQLISSISTLNNDFEYKIYLREKPQNNLPKKGNKLSYKVLKPRKLWTQWRLPLDLYFSKPRPNIFFTPGHYSPRFSPCPTVCSILDLSFLKYPKSFKPLVLKQLKNWTYYSAKKAVHILTISQSSKRDIIKHYQIKPSKITVTYPGVDDIFHTTPSVLKTQKLKQKYNINESEYLIFIGTRQPKKNLNRLIKAFNQLNPSNLKLLIVGKTWKQFTSGKKETSPNIIETGFIPNHDLPALIKGAKGLCLPSLYEGFGFPVAQAMTLGTPVVVSNVSSLPEIVAGSGILVDPLSVSSIASGLKQILSMSAEKKVKLTTQAKKRATQFNWQKCAKKTLEVLNEVSA